jgi:RNA polymerase sigma-32 factor
LCHPAVLDVARRPSDPSKEPKPKEPKPKAPNPKAPNPKAPKLTAKTPSKRAPSARSTGKRGRGDDSDGPESESPDSLRADHGGRHDGDDEHEGRDDRDERDDGEVVEVVGEVVDDGDIADEEADEPASMPPESAPMSSAALSRTDPLQAYLREVQRYKLLTPQEEQDLTRQYVDTQDVRTAAKLVTANLRLVVKLAYEYRRAYKNIMDLIQEGNIGLMQAVKRYDPTRGVKLSSYAAWWIRAYMLRFILNNWRLVKLGTTQAQRKLFFNLNKEKAKLSALGIDPSADLIAERLGVETHEVVEMDRRLASAEASLDAPVGDAEGRSVSRVDLLPSATSGPDSLMERHEMDQMVSDRLKEFRKTLKGKDVIIFDKRMAAEDPLTLQELGDEFGVSRERVRQLEARLHHKLRDYLKSELGDAVTRG